MDDRIVFKTFFYVSMQVGGLEKSGLLLYRGICCGLVLGDSEAELLEPLRGQVLGGHQTIVGGASVQSIEAVNKGLDKNKSKS